MSIADVTGFTFANGCIQPGSREMGANAELVKTSGSSGMNTAACTVSGSLTARPMYSENVISAIPNMIATTTMATAPATPVLEAEADDERGDRDQQRLQAEPDAVAHRAAEQEAGRARSGAIGNGRSCRCSCRRRCRSPTGSPANTIVWTSTAGTTKSL